MNQKLKSWVPVPLRALLGLILGVAGLDKFVRYSQEVTAFTSYGIPTPELMVPIVGIIELVAAILIAFGIAGRVGAVITVPVMITAIATAGVAGTNVFVLLGAIAILLLGTGRYSFMTEEELRNSLQNQTDTSGGSDITSGE